MATLDKAVRLLPDAGTFHSIQIMDEEWSGVFVDLVDQKIVSKGQVNAACWQKIHQSPVLPQPSTESSSQSAKVLFDR